MTLGILLFGSASLAIVFLEQLSMLYGLRVIQALGAGLASVSAMAVVRDISAGREGASNMMRVVQVMMAAPLLAPMLGMVIYRYLGWHAIFLFLVGYCIILLMLFLKNAPETSPMEGRSNFLASYWQLAIDRRVWPGMISIIGTYGVMFSFITASPTVYMGYFGVSPELFPLAFGCNVIGMLIMGQLKIRLLKRYSAASLIVRGQLVQLVAGSLLVGYLLLSDQPQFVVVLLMTVSFISCHSLVVSNSISSTTEYFPDRAGTTTALLSASGFMAGASIGSLTGLFADGTPLPMAVIMLLACLGGVVMRGALAKAESS